jgi:hypothetical protein
VNGAGVVKGRVGDHPQITGGGAEEGGGAGGLMGAAAAAAGGDGAEAAQLQPEFSLRFRYR